MDIKSCLKCGKLFAYDGKHKICDVCRKSEEDDYQKVKDYLWENPKSTITKVHEETGVEKEKILKFIKDDRLIADGIDAENLLECERCGIPIMSGRYCVSCQQELIDGFGSGLSKNKKKKEDEKKKDAEDRMFIVDRMKKNDRRK